ncbi:MAG: signal peptidase I [Nocardioides sp.]
MTTEDREDLPAQEQEDSRSSHSNGESRDKEQLPLWQETILLLGVALGLAILIKAVLVQAFYIPSESMEPGLVKNDRILVQKVSYWGSASPQRGDVVVFKDPGGWLPPMPKTGARAVVTNVMAKIGLYPEGGHLVKRVIGVAGDKIKCCDAKGRIMVNGTPLDEGSYVKVDDPNTPEDEDGQCRGPMKGTCKWTAGPVPEGHLFVMGDNRAHSADSSYHLCAPQATDCVDSDAYVPVGDVVGKVFVVLWPANHFRWVTRPDDFTEVTSP